MCELHETWKSFTHFRNILRPVTGQAFTRLAQATVASLLLTRELKQAALDQLLGVRNASKERFQVSNNWRPPALIKCGEVSCDTRRLGARYLWRRIGALSGRLGLVLLAGLFPWVTLENVMVLAGY